MCLTVLVTIFCSLKNERKKRPFESHEVPFFLVSEEFTIRKKCVTFNSYISIASTFNPSNIILYAVNSAIAFQFESIAASTSDTIRK